MAHIFLIAAAVIAGIAAWYDHRTGHIPNWLTLGSLGIAPVVHFVLTFTRANMDAAVLAAGFSLLGAVMVGLVPVVLYRLGGIFGGDVKLLAALGAICGTRLGVEAELYAFIVAAMFALGKMAYEGKLTRTLGNTLALVGNPVLPKGKRREVSPDMMTEMRFGPSIFVGVLATLLMAWRPL